ncbi:zinc finger CCCH domain-containing protein 18-like isoform X1 [Dendrobium catenatum]|uniref:Zinc finger CCCH domain-containing protein 54 n=2 Tax=Dendrobium catenatum TaxID=906689 RepID=A0A2I0XIM1_9ASPA|nr:zinc finger CCCH domain-containing protein 18-like isoform X1 [Dendrobium catenatum]PKU87739.1 Zinc finger CCCH domain-containing protein 54 [Dendrobium catenatum]
MEIEKYTQDLLQRIQKIEPENAIKIFGYLLLQHSIEEIMEYVSGTEEKIHSLIAEAKSYFMLSPKFKFPDHLHPCYSHAISLPLSTPPSIRVPVLNQHTVNHQSPFQNLDHFPHNDSWTMEEHLYPSNSIGVDLPVNFRFPGFSFGSRSQALPSDNYFYKGYCKLGQSCKSFHDHANPDCFNTMFGISVKEFPIEDHMFSPGLIEKLEMEITKLLRTRRGVPVSLSLLPVFYQEMYGKPLLPEGYLTESRRHGKVVLSLMKLLAQLTNIRLFDRPHGQYWVILDEDVSKYMEFMTERNDPGNSSSHQIYLTFPAESTFTDADVQNYFNQFGPVHDVRIPHQEKRMFGFVSFYHPQTVKQILEMGHPHNICGSRVLVKPYIEKSKLVQRKYAEKLNDEMYTSSASFEMDNALSPRQRACENSQFHKKQQIEDCEPAVDLMRRQLELQLCQKPLTQQPYLRNGLEESNFLQDRFSSLSIMSQENTDNDNKTWQPCSNCNNQDSLIQLPENPFASPRF